MEFEWDPEKASENIGKHGIAFEDAARFSWTRDVSKASMRDSIMMKTGMSSLATWTDASETRKGGRSDWWRIDAVSDEAAEAAALSDPDAPPHSGSALQRMQRAPDVRAIRDTLGMTVEAFAATFGLAAARVRGWESGHKPVLPSERAFLNVIGARPEFLRSIDRMDEPRSRPVDVAT